MRPRPESVRSRPRPKIFREAEAKTYEAEATASRIMQHININHFHIETDISQTELT